MLFLVLACAPEPTPLCPAYSGFSELGRVWEYAAFEGDERWEVALTALGPEAVTVEGPGWTEVWRCDAEGLWAVSRHEQNEEFAADWVYDPPARHMPAEIAPGDAWTIEAAWIYVDTTGARVTKSRSTQVEVREAVTSNVAAGAFEALEWHVLDEQAGSATEYRDAEIGLVLTEGAQLVGVEEPAG